MIRARFVTANGLRHHVLEHPGDDARTVALVPRVPVVLLHGYLDTARTFHAVINGLGARGHRVIAPDFRGHGETDRTPAGGYYHFPDYIADLAGVLTALEVPRAHLVAHSMGGSVATLYAGALPQAVVSLSLLEGVGPPAMPAEVAADRTTAWLMALTRHRDRPQRVYATLDEVVRRLRVSHPDVPLEALRTAAENSVGRATEGEGFVFRFDPLHQTTSPGRFDAEGFEAHIARITCPVLMVDGGTSDAFPELVVRARKYPLTRTVTLAGAGHMMHWTQPEALVREVADFLEAHGREAPQR